MGKNKIMKKVGPSHKKTPKRGDSKQRRQHIALSWSFLQKRWVCLKKFRLNKHLLATQTHTHKSVQTHKFITRQQINQTKVKHMLLCRSKQSRGLRWVCVYCTALEMLILNVYKTIYQEENITPLYVQPNQRNGKFKHLKGKKTRTKRLPISLWSLWEVTIFGLLDSYFYNTTRSIFLRQLVNKRIHM